MVTKEILIEKELRDLKIVLPKRDIPIIKEKKEIIIKKKAKTKKQKKEDDKKLKPIIIENTEIIAPEIDFDNLLQIDKSKAEDESDNYFRAVVDNLMSSDNISLKTEYLSPNENFAGAKLEFLARYGNMPYLKDFIKILEIKRVSLHRKSRIELIKAFEKRDEEIQAQNRLITAKSMLGNV